jgi:hypothetical protein
VGVTPTKIFPPPGLPPEISLTDFAFFLSAKILKGGRCALCRISYDGAYRSTSLREDIYYRQMSLETLLIGVDVGGTNTDSVLVDPHQVGELNKGVLSWNKDVTTSDS